MYLPSLNAQANARRSHFISPSDAKAPSGLQYHLADVYLSELEKALESFASVRLSRLLIIPSLLTSVSRYRTPHQPH